MLKLAHHSHSETYIELISSGTGFGDETGFGEGAGLGDGKGIGDGEGIGGGLRNYCFALIRIKALSGGKSVSGWLNDW